MEHCHRAHSSSCTLAIGRGWSQELQSASVHPNNPAAYQRIIQNGYQLTKRCRNLLPSSSWSCLGIRSLGRGISSLSSMGARWHSVWNPLGLVLSPGCPCRRLASLTDCLPPRPKGGTRYPRHGESRKCHPWLDWLRADLVGRE